MKTFADKIIGFNRSLVFKGTLPEKIRVMNPFRENEEALSVSSAFYKKYYEDNESRHLILGINPGRHGAGLTGIPFTDPKKLQEKCGIEYNGKPAHELSSVFVYEVIDAFGGAVDFYKKFYINSICPLGFVVKDTKSKEKNYNYYDSAALQEAVRDFIVDNLKKQISFGIETDICFCMGTGKNVKFLNEINDANGFFKKIIPLEHPRYVMQYKLKQKQSYIKKYIKAFEEMQ